MALASDRQASVVDPSKGVYVEMEGIMEVRYLNSYGESEKKEDFYDFQNRQKQIPDDFCHLDRDTGMQAVFICLVCYCDLKSVKSLRDHAKGNKHIRKAVEKKRQILGLPLEPQNAPRIKKMKKEQPRIDVNKTLKERLQDSAQLPVGLPFIEEFRNPEDRSAYRMYSCTLEGCKSAWGTSDDIYHHVINYKHARNFFKAMNPEDARVMGLNNADILKKVTELHEKESGSDGIDYGVIKVVEDYQKWKELRDRPDDWSEKKAKLGLVGGYLNSNLEPLGERKGRSLRVAAETSGGWSRDDDRDERASNSPSIFDEKAWDGWKPKSLLARYHEFRNQIDDGLNDIKEEVEKFEGNEESEEFKKIKWMFENYRRDLDLHENYKAPPEIGQQKFDIKMNEWNEILDKAEGELMEKLDKEEKSVKHVGVLLQEVEDEMENYGASRNSKKYQNLKDRMADMTKEMSKLKPSKDLNKIRKEEYKMEIPKKKTEKEKTRGAKQIAKENWETLCFYRNMILGANGLYFCVMTLLGRSYFSFDIGMFGFCCVIYISCFQVLNYMGKPKTSPQGQLLDCGMDLNMQQGPAEHVKDMIILTCATQELSIFSNYTWLLLLGAPIRAFYMLWVSVIAPWIFAPPEEEDTVGDKKRQKMERKLKRLQR